MARIRSVLPWGMLLLFGALFLLSWWIEDCLIYADWNHVRAFQIASLIFTQFRLDLAVGLIVMALEFPTRLGAQPGASAEPSVSNDDGRRVREARRRREYAQFMETHVKRIGIVLAGGGASGAYQAGALKAIYEFLRDY